MLRQSWIWLIRLATATVAGLLLLIAAALVLGRFWLGTHLDEFRPRIEAALSHQAALSAHIDHIGLEWHGVVPEFRLSGVRVQDRGGQVDLSLQQVRAHLSLLPLLIGRFDFARLQIDQPVVRVERRKDGRLLVAGILLPTPSEEPGSPFVDWLLVQHEVTINDGRLEWLDQRASGEVLALPHLQLSLQSKGSQHAFDLAVDAPPGLMQGLHLQGRFTGSDSRHLEDWQGTAKLKLAFLDVGQVRRFVAAPVDWRSGRGSVAMALGFHGAQVETLQTDGVLDAVALTLASDLPELRFERLSGHLDYQSSAHGFRLVGRQLLAQGSQAAGAPLVRPADFDFQVDGAAGSAHADILDLGALAALTESLPLPPAMRAVVQAHAPRGLVQGLEARWDGQPLQQGRFLVRARVSDVSVQAVAGQPGIQNFSGTLKADERGGTLAVDAHDFGLVLPGIFERALELKQVQAAVHWTRTAGRADVTLERLRLDDPDIGGTVAGTLSLEGSRAQQARLNGQFDHIEFSGVPRFLPLVVGRDARDWLKTALRSGHARAVQLELTGNLQQFPFTAGRGGEFHVHIPFDGGRLDYAPGWPALTAVRGTIDFDGPGITVRAPEAHVERLLARGITAHVADLGADHPVLALDGVISGPLQSGLDFILQSPLKRTLGEFAGTFRAQGEGQLDLHLAVPLDRVDDTRVAGDLQADGATLRDPSGGIPLLSDVHTRLHITDSGASSDDLSARVLGGIASGRLATAANGDVELQAKGQVDGREVAATYGGGHLPFLRDTGDWEGHFRFDRQSSDIAIQGRLPVFGSPAEFTLEQHGATPLTLAASGSTPLARILADYAPVLIPVAEGTLDWKFGLRHEQGKDQISGNGHFTLLGRPGEITLTGRPEALGADLSGGADAPSLLKLAGGLPDRLLSGSTNWQARLDERTGAPLLRVSSDLRGLRIDLPAPFGKSAADAVASNLTLARLRGSSDLYLSGGIAAVVGVAALVPAAHEDPLRRLAVRIGGPAVLPSTDGISLSGGLARVDIAAWRSAFEGITSAAGAAPGTAAATLPVNVDLRIEQMLAGRYRFEPHRWQAHSTATGWHLGAHGPQIEGEADWTSAAPGRLSAQLERLQLSGQEAADGSAPEPHKSPSRTLPALAVNIREFQWDGRALGTLELHGEPEPEGWQLVRLGLTQPHGDLVAEGHWLEHDGRSLTRLNATIDAADTGALLLALGYPKALSRGKTRLSAKLEWPGDPVEFATAGLTGTMDLDSRSGQFLTLEPGVGRLLGLLSLQALPRRITLDFRDIFSQGFAFDAITGHFTIDQGTMRTSNLDMSGPAARVRINGSASLVDETQDLDVRVSPAIGDGVSLATTVLGGPVVGAATYLVQKLLRNPIDQILTYDYHVSGGWDDPQVVRVGRPPAGNEPGAAGKGVQP